MHAVTALKECGKRGVREVVLHLQQVNQLWHVAALFNDLFEVEIRVCDEFVNRFLVSENTILISFTVLKHAQVRLAWHEQTLLDDVDQTEAEEVEWNMHEVWCG